MGASNSTPQTVVSVNDAISAAVGQDDTYYPRHSEDAVAALNILRHRLPSELVLQVLEYAQYWIRSEVYRNDRLAFTENDCRDRTPYLTSRRIQGNRFPVREIKIDIWSHDQGWSSYREDYGTYRNSWTWFELGIQRTDDRDDLTQGEELRLVTNIHASKDAKHHQIIYRDDQNLHWLSNLQAGDRISIIPRARFPGWKNFVDEASIEIYTDPIL
ncbi:hypothetical protein PENANT_c015G08665 [Penicillium antarcticum]|uniref:Uncharacterized protein n=1 Tax=Penicillium antarcticum TaxID=416450 RepID=A0A1V6Q442_9EURO|nr:uncharacterized protein N7508_004875 [Penicillium antarcticum]KAJ5305860.1 hypothetical protein N7508_004875 [Penicillium antarcticum]OQD83787.1 hypothetical protein PENANT_c015G08665 [Penicillium antarcticum]